MKDSVLSVFSESKDVHALCLINLFDNYLSLILSIYSMFFIGNFFNLIIFLYFKPKADEIQIMLSNNSYFKCTSTIVLLSGNNLTEYMDAMLRSLGYVPCPFEAQLQQSTACLVIQQPLLEEKQPFSLSCFDAASSNP